MSDVVAPSDAAGFVTTRGRPPPPSVLGAVSALAWRALLKIKHVPFQLFDVTIMPIMFTLLFTFMFSGAIAGSISEYIQYLLPGILVQTIIFITVYTGVGLNGDIPKGLHDRFRSLPVWQPSPIVGALSADLIRYSVAGVVILIVGFMLGFRPQAPLGLLAAFVLILTFAFALSWIWIIFGMKVQSPESVMTTSFIFLMPLTFMSDIFVPLPTLPDWLRPAVANNPVTHLAAASRALAHGQSPGDHLWWVLGVSAALVLVFAPIAMRMYRRER
jgi:ABC-2 type transport system permease protein